MAAPRLILASASPRRLDLLRQIGVTPALVLHPDIDETPQKDELPTVYAARLASEKAARAAQDAQLRDGDLILAADTVVALGRRILPKTETEAEARRCLELMSGRRHRVLTAVTLLAVNHKDGGGKASERLVASVVAFKRFTESEIALYLASGEWQGKAGGYAVQGLAAAYVRFVSGSYSSVVGLPLHEVATLLSARGIALGQGPNGP
ncbi:MAG TPA: Maf family nucleotide pyrophosphatase [Alphaproteobacteria bacterium]|jgi:septum formation protein